MQLFTAERSSSESLSDNPIFQRHVFAYNEAAKRISGKVLEIGCGTGYGISILASKADEYFAVDKFVANLEQLPENVHFTQMHVPELKPFNDNTFDFVISFQVIEHIENDHLYLKEIYRVLKPGGVFIFTTPNKAMSLTRNPYHVREYSVTEMHKITGQYFKDYQLLGVYGNEKVEEYYEENKKGVKKITRFDILNLQYRLPRWALQIPYDIANRLNRLMLAKSNKGLVANVSANDFFLKEADEFCHDYFGVCKK